jgi:hypothetical protein
MRKSYRDAILAEANAAKAIVETAERESRELSDVERTDIETRLGKAAELRKTGEAEEAFRKQMTDLSDGLGLAEPDPNTAPPAAKDRTDLHTGRKSIGERVITHDAWKSAQRRTERQLLREDAGAVGADGVRRHEGPVLLRRP